MKLAFVFELDISLDWIWIAKRSTARPTSRLAFEVHRSCGGPEFAELTAYWVRRLLAV